MEEEDRVVVEEDNVELLDPVDLEEEEVEGTAAVTDPPNPLNQIVEVDIEEDEDQKRAERRKSDIHRRKHRFELHKFDELPEYMKDNQFIQQGYRVHFSVALCIKSLFKWHNETLSIWTRIVWNDRSWMHDIHLSVAYVEQDMLGFVLFLILMFVTFSAILDNPGSIDIFIFFIFLVVAQMQMLFSALFHMFGCLSPTMYTWLAKLDYSGITVMIVGSYYPPLYYGLACHQPWRIFYLVCISTLGVIGLIVSFFKVFSTPRFRIVRTVFFLIFGFFAVFPMPHMIALNGIDFMWPILWKEFLMGASYTIGSVFYSARIPERWYPGLDYGWYSHPIWHLFVIAGGLFQFWTCIFCFQQRRAHPC